MFKPDLLRRDILRSGLILPMVGPILGLGACAPLGDVINPQTHAHKADLAGQDIDLNMRDAFYYAFALYEFARTEQVVARCIGNPGTINTIKKRAQLSDDTQRTVTAPNNDTIYASSFLDLAAGPVEVVAPDCPERYFSIVFMDAFTDCFAYIGTRATHGKGGRFWVVGPQWQGKAPAGVTVFKATTNDVWMLARILVNGPADLDAAHRIQDQIYVNVAADRPPARGFETAGVPEVTDPANFLALVNEVLRRSPGGAGQLARATKFAKYGIGVDTPPSQTLLDAWAAYLVKGLQDLRDGFLFRDLVVNGWSYQPRGVGNFGTNDRLRSIVALGGIAALSEEEAMYFHANFDTTGARLMGENAYRWRVPPGGVPAKAFWSLTMYEVTPDGRFFLTKNPIGRYSIGDRTAGLVFEPDGSLEILLQHTPPQGRLAANWLPTPEGPMRLALRAYCPKPELIERRWRLPALERVTAS